MKKKFHLLLTLPAVIVLAVTIFSLSLPYLCDLFLLPQFTRELPFAEKELSLSRISPWKVRGTLTLADEELPVVSVPRFELHYTPGDLFRGKATTLLIDSASLHLEIRDGYPAIRGLVTDSASKGQKERKSALLLPLAVEKIIIKNSTITLHKNKQETLNLIIDGRFTLDFLKQVLQKNIISSLSGDIIVRGDVNFRSELEVTSLADGHELQLHLQAPDLSQLATFFPKLLELQPAGEFSLDGRVKTEQFNKISDYELAVRFSRFAISKNGFLLVNNSPEEPIVLNIAGNLEQARYSLAGAVLAAPERCELDLEGQVGIVKGDFTGTGQILFEGTQAPVAIQFNGDNSETGTRVGYQLQSDAYTIANNFSFSPFMGVGTVNIEKSVVSGNLSGRLAKIIDKSRQVTLVDLELQLPFQFSLQQPEKTPEGSFTIQEVRYKGVNSGRLQSTLKLSREAVDFTTMFSTPFEPGLQLTCNGSAQLTSDFSFGCRIPETVIGPSSLPPYIQLPDELSFSGKIKAGGEFSVIKKIPAGKLVVEFHDGTLTQGVNSLEDINLGIVFPRLPLIQSSPGQLCTISSVNLGKIKLSDARIRFRIEDEQSIFIEKSRLSWCGGKVETGSLRISRSMKELETTLYCDRLGFTELLGQFGIEDTEGEGSLNGRLPLHISNQKVVFDDGFLFSTPGNSGIVRFNNTRQLRQGMGDISNSAYLDYSMQALENFSYNWTKLSFNSEEEDLLITMQLDGKPEKTLPFGYKNGHIVPSSKGPGLQHPIRLDVNFRLPLQDLFQYGKNIQSIMENL
jgi:hypothetical protein